MSLDIAALGKLGADLQPDARAAWAPLQTLQKHIDGQLLRTWMPENADAEYRDLLRKSASPWLGFARDAIAQGCIVSATRTRRSGSVRGARTEWMAARMS